MIYTAEHIAKYFAGKLSPQDMYAMEKAALDDEFLADAMEGYSNVSYESLEHTLINLKQNFTSKSTTAKVVSLKSGTSRTWYRAAAAVLLIGSVGAITYQAIKKNKNATFTESVAKTEPTNPQLKSADIHEGIDPIITDANKDKNLPPTDTTQYIAGTKKIIPPINTTKDKNNDIASTDIPKSLPKENIYKDLPEEDEELGSLSSPGSKTGSAFGKKSQNSFLAQVVGPNDNPVPFANIKSAKTETYTDAKGNVKLVSDNEVLNVQVNSTGYQQQTYNLRSDIGKNKIVLGRASSNTRRATIVQDTDTNVEPVDGWSNYNNYIQNNTEIPKKALKRNIQGDIEVSFDVQPSGKATNARIEQSLCDPCDKEVKEVIEKGPSWRVKKGQSNRGLLKVRF